MKLLLFVGPECPKCHKVIRGMVNSRIISKEIAEGIPVSPHITVMHNKPALEIYDTGTVDGLAEAAFHGVLTRPCLIVTEDDKEVARMSGAEEILRRITEWAEKT